MNEIVINKAGNAELGNSVVSLNALLAVLDFLDIVYNQEITRDKNGKERVSKVLIP